jgi:hypothetical protein
MLQNLNAIRVACSAHRPVTPDINHGQINQLKTAIPYLTSPKFPALPKKQPSQPPNSTRQTINH